MENITSNFTPSEYESKRIPRNAAITGTDENESDAPFGPDDFAFLASAKGEVSHHLISAVEHLIQFSLDPEDQFTFFSGSETARLTRGLFKRLFKAGEFLESDYLFAEQNKVEHLSGEMSAFLQMRDEHAPAPVVGIETPPIAEFDGEGRPTQAYFEQCVDALEGIAEFARSVANGSEFDCFCEVKTALVMRRQFARGLEALDVVTGAFEDARGEMARRAQDDLNAIVGPLWAATGTATETDTNTTTQGETL